MLKVTKKAKNDANSHLHEATDWLLGWSGLVEFDEKDGSFTFISEASWWNDDNDTAQQIADIGAWLAYGAKYTTTMYKNIDAAVKEVEDAKECLSDYKKMLDMQKGGSSDAVIYDPNLSDPEKEAHFDARVAAHKKRYEKILKQKKLIEQAEIDIMEVLRKRAAGLLEEPVFQNAEAILSGTSFESQMQKHIDAEEEKEEIIRLVFGPPKSKEGQFLLSVDGLYYDSQTSAGVQPVLSELEDRQKNIKEEDRWKLEHDPNLGGRGVQISSKEVENYVNTLFDPDVTDESSNIQGHYDKDHFLLTLISQKESHILDLSANVNQLELSGASTAIVTNTRQSILSEIALHDVKIRKRKKQIEIAIKAPRLYGSTTIYDKGQVPINDFSYLQDVNLAIDIDKQRRLVLDQSDVTGVVLPLKPKFVVNPGNQNHTSIDHLLIPEIGTGGFLTTASGVDASGGTTLSITNPIVTDGLIAVYNFLNSRVEIAPSSVEFRVLNCASPDDRNNAQLVAPDASCVFPSGLGLPYLKGVASLKTVTSYTDSADISALGNYVRLPDTEEFQDWTYSTKGFTFETWTHIPTLSSVTDWTNDVSAQYRLLLSCENTGLVSSVDAQNDVNRLAPDFGDSVARGMMIGFTTDKRISLGEDPTNFRVDAKSATNLPASAMSFFIAPTQAKNASSIGLINNSTTGECASAAGWYGLSLNTSTVGENDTYFNHVCSAFMLITVSVDVPNDKVSVFLNGNLMTTANINTVFGVPEKTPPNLPSFLKANSFKYTSSSVNEDAPEQLKTGPSTNDFFTPWIIGGGWTDGMVRNPNTGVSVGNFMGENYGGFRSGLDGFIGSTKFYNKPLEQVEVRKNYDGQKSFFNNIQITVQ